MNTFVKNVMFTAFQNLEMECFFFMWAIVNLYYASLTPDKYRKSSIKPPPRDLLISNTFEELGVGWAYLRRGLI